MNLNIKNMNYINLDISLLDECLLESASQRRDKHVIISVALQISFAFIKRDTDEMTDEGFKVAIKRSGLTMSEANKVMKICPSVLERVDGYVKCHLATPTIAFSNKQALKGKYGGEKSRKKKQIESSSSVGVLVTPRSSTDEINAAILASKGSYKPPIK